MENYKSNSHKSRNEQKALPPPEKKIEKVITGSAKTRKKSGMRKFSDVFISEDAGNVKSYIFMDVLLPAAKKLISDVVTNGIDMLLYGEAGRSKKRSGTSKVSYSSYYDRDDRRRERRPYSSRNSFDYDDFVYETRGDAEAVLDTMYEIIQQYDEVTVADVYEASEITNHNYTANNYGWRDLRGSDIVRTTRGEYWLKLPKAIPLD